MARKQTKRPQTGRFRPLPAREHPASCGIYGVRDARSAMWRGDRQRGRRGRRRRVADVQRARRVGEDEVVDERAVAADRLGADAGRAGDDVARRRARGRSARTPRRTRGGWRPCASRSSPVRQKRARHPPGAGPGQRGAQVARAHARAGGRRRARRRAARSGRAGPRRRRAWSGGRRGTAGRDPAPGRSATRTSWRRSGRSLR